MGTYVCIKRSVFRAYEDVTNSRDNGTINIFLLFGIFYSECKKNVVESPIYTYIKVKTYLNSPKKLNNTKLLRTKK